VARKLGCRDVVSAVHPGCLFYITDSVSSRGYLVDTGSAFSVMPWESSDTPVGPTLTAADGRRIPCWGERPFTMTIGGVPRRWNFLLAAVSFPIIGIDLLRCRGLLVDVANLRLLPGELPVAAVDLAADPGAPAAQPCSYAKVVNGTSCSTPGPISFSDAVQLISPVASLAGIPPLLPGASSAASPYHRQLRIGWAISVPASPRRSAPIRPFLVFYPLTEYSTSSLLLGSRPLLDSAAWTPPGWRQPRRSFRLCSTRALFAAPAASGVALCTC
jgi:hypothetical protein